MQRLSSVFVIGVLLPLVLLACGPRHGCTALEEHPSLSANVGSSNLWEWYASAVDRTRAAWEAAFRPTASVGGGLTSVASNAGPSLAARECVASAGINSVQFDTGGAAHSESAERRRRRTDPTSQLGRRLLEDGDVAGAEMVCLHATRLDPDDVAAKVCLGDALVALHQIELQRMGARGGLGSSGRLASAITSFQNAAFIDPTNARARLGLGTAMLLMATKGGAILSSATSETSADKIHHALLHLEASARLTSSTEKNDTEVSTMHRVAVRNTALANLALGDVASAIPLLREAADLSPPRSEGGIEDMSEQVNLGGALLEEGLVEDAMNLMNEIADEYCKDNEQDISSHGMSALCSILFNNLGIGHEMQSSVQGATASYQLSIHWDNNSSSSNLKNMKALEEGALESWRIQEEKRNDLSLGHDDLSPRSLAMRGESDDLSDFGSSTEKEQGQKDSSDSVGGELEDAIVALENMALGKPDRARSWISLSKARSHAGDKAGALQDAAKAVNVAVGDEEVEMANRALEDVLDSFVLRKDEIEDRASESVVVPHNALIESAVDNAIPIELKNLRLEREILQLKVQLLEQREHSRASCYFDDSEHGWEAKSPPQSPNRPLKGDSARQRSFKVSEVDNGEAVERKAIIKDDNSREVAGLEGEHIADGEMEDLGDGEQPEATNNNLDFFEESVEGEVSPTTSKFETKFAYKEEETKYDGVGAIDESLPEIPTSSAGEEDNVIQQKTLSFSEEDQQELRLSTEELEAEEWAEETVKTNLGIDSSPNIDEGTSLTRDETQGTAKDGKDESKVSFFDGAFVEPEGASLSEEIETEAVNDSAAIEPLVLPELFNPTKSSPGDITSHAASYMKLADTYMHKEHYKLASKQFAKVLKKAPDHIPAMLGYATSLEREGQRKQTAKVALIYGNATRAAIVQGEDGLAIAAFRRAINIAQSAQGDEKLETLQKLSEIAHTKEAAADIYFVIGDELIKYEGREEEAMSAFAVVNALSCNRTDDSDGGVCYGHGKSLTQMAKVALNFRLNAREALEYTSSCLEYDTDEEIRAEAHVTSGRAKMMLGDVEASIKDMTSALDLNITEPSAEAHHYLALALMQTGAEQHIVNAHFENSLNMGWEINNDAIKFLGENNAAVKRATNRQSWLEYERVEASTKSQRGGIMSGGGNYVGNWQSIFASSTSSSESNQPRGHTNTEPSQLDILEQGATKYDGSVPTGEEEGAQGGSVLQRNGAATSRSVT